MNYSNTRLLDELAAHYALGTLRGAARRRFESICQRDPQALQALHRWEDKLVGMLAEVKPVQPPQSVWVHVQKRLGHGAQENRSLMQSLIAWWNQTQLAIAGGVAALALTLAIVVYVSFPQTQHFATIASETQVEQWRIETQKDRETLEVMRAATTALDPNRDYELWALPDSGAAPVSLGLMPKTGKRELQLTSAQRTALAGASKVAVSLEPIGGSPTGAPTGPVLFVAEVRTS